MAMTVGQDAEQDQEVMAAINTTPLVDVMLVLLIIFMITAPLMSHKIQVDLPESVATPNVDPPGTTRCHITCVCGNP